MQTARSASIVHAMTQHYETNENYTNVDADTYSIQSNDTNMINNNVNHFIEIGPGKVLSGLVKRINKEVKISTINNQNDIESLEI